MRIEFDPDKNRQNIETRGRSFELVERFEWETALVGRDDRRDYGETRFWALGAIDGLIYSLVFTMRPGRLRVISLRRASRRERILYAAKA